MRSASVQVGWLLRMPKCRQPPDPVSAFLESHIWAPFLRGLNTDALSALDEVYASLVIGSLVDTRYLSLQHWVPVEPSFLAALAQRPCLAGLDVGVARVMLTCDARLLPAVSGRDVPDPPTVSIEIKPKWGALPFAHSVPARHHAVKLSASRYQLHQRLKAATGAVRTVSDYDPLDLFSGEAGRVWTALLALARSPQNNLAVAVDGGHACLQDAARALHGAGPGAQDASEEALLALVRDVLMQEDVLAQILAVQRLCSTDIHVVHKQYHVMVEAAARAPRDQAALSPTPALEAASRLLREYLTSCTARDCALMLALQLERPRPGAACAQTADGPGRAALPGGAAVLYRVTLVDLDRKAVTKIPRHLALDADIMRVALANESDCG